MKSGMEQKIQVQCGAAPGLLRHSLRMQTIVTVTEIMMLNVLADCSDGRHKQ